MSEFLGVWDELASFVKEDPLLSQRHMNIHRRSLLTEVEPVTGDKYLVPEIDGSPMFVDDVSGTVFKVWLFAEGLEEISLIPYCRETLESVKSYSKRIVRILPEVPLKQDEVVHRSGARQSKIDDRASSH